MKNLFILLAVVALAAFPVYWHHQADKIGESAAVSESSSTPVDAGEPAEIFTGADSLAKKMIGKINPEYVPWFEPLWEPPSGEVENLLFVVQAVIGAGALFYVLGFIRGRSQGRQGR